MIESGERLLSLRGFDKTSTTTIAKLAGVSIGSLYQYFPGKEAVIAALIDRRLEQDIQAVRAVLNAHRDAPFEEAAANLLNTLLPDSAEQRAFLREIVQVLERTQRLEAVQRAMDCIAEEFADFLQARRHEFRRDLDPAFAAHALVWGGRAVMLARLRVETELDVPRLRGELLSIAHGYLKYERSTKG